MVSITGLSEPLVFNRATWKLHAQLPIKKLSENTVILYLLVVRC